MCAQEPTTPGLQLHHPLSPHRSTGFQGEGEIAVGLAEQGQDSPKLLLFQELGGSPQPPSRRFSSGLTIKPLAQEARFSVLLLGETKGSPGNELRGLMSRKQREAY